MPDGLPLTLGRSLWAIEAEFALPYVVESHFDDNTMRLLEARIKAPQVSMHQQTGNKKGAVAVVPLTGVLTPRASLLSILFGGGGGLEEFRENFQAALADDDIGSIVLDIDSPGGSIHGIAEMADEVFAARGEKPIIAVANHLAGSAAYWIGAQADEFVVSPTGSVGAIGVYMTHTDRSGANEKAGVKPTYVSAGKYKVEGNSDAPLGEEAQADMQKDVDLLYGKFVDSIARARGVSALEVREGYGEGRVVVADRALDAGLVDRVDTIDNVVGGVLEAGVEAAPAAAAMTISYEPNGIFANGQPVFQITDNTSTGWTITNSNGVEVMSAKVETETETSEDPEDARALLSLEFAD